MEPFTATAADSSAVSDPSLPYSQARRLISTIEFQLQQLEQAGHLGRPAEEDSQSAAERRHLLAQNVNLLSQEVALMERLVNDPSGAGAATNLAKRELWRKRVFQLQSDAAALRRSVERYLRVSHASALRERQEAERAALLGSGAGTSQAVAIDAMLSERTSLSHSTAMIDDFTSLATNVLSSLKSQRGTLKSAHRRALDMAASLGLSNSLMRVIERRTKADKILVYGGMLFVCFFLFVIWWVTS